MKKSAFKALLERVHEHLGKFKDPAVGSQTVTRNAAVAEGQALVVSLADEAGIVLFEEVPQEPITEVADVAEVVPAEQVPLTEGEPGSAKRAATKRAADKK
jgi:hypothetical protein